MKLEIGPDSFRMPGSNSKEFPSCRFHIESIERKGWHNSSRRKEYDIISRPRRSRALARSRVFPDVSVREKRTLALTRSRSGPFVSCVADRLFFHRERFWDLFNGLIV